MRTLRLLSLLVAMSTAPLAAQSVATPFGAQCATGPDAVREHCFQVAEAVQIMGPRTALVLSGGNPVPGTASTLGMRIGRTPRFSIGARVTGTGVELPGIASPAAPQLDFNAIGVSLDAGVGLFNGFTLGPTVGGFAALDLLGSVGRVGLPAGDGFEGAVLSWAGGARLGLLRESFTAPGVSVSAMYRRVGDLEFGDVDLADTDAWFRLADLTNVSVRAAASKRVLGLGLTAGAGWDWYDAAAEAAVRTGGTSAALILRDDALETSRSTIFGNAAFTVLILHTVAEVGWQSGGTTKAEVPDSGRLEDVGFYGSIALRLTL